MNTRALYIIGGPGTGKSTLLRHVLEELDLVTMPAYMPNPVVGKEFKVQPLCHLDTGDYHGVYLGINRPGVHPGVDALGRGCIPDATQWVSTFPLPPLIVGEGHLLGNTTFLPALAARSLLTVVHLTAPPEEVAARTAARGTQQKPTFLKAMTSRARNLAEKLVAQGVHVAPVDTTTVTPRQLAQGLALTL